MGRSLEPGEIIPVGPILHQLCAMRCRPRAFRRSPSRFCESAGANAVAVSEDEVREAMRFAWREHQLTVEPGGAVALAALLAGKVEIVGGTVAVVSGGNVDPELHARIIAGRN